MRVKLELIVICVLALAFIASVIMSRSLDNESTITHHPCVENLQINQAFMPSLRVVSNATCVPCVENVQNNQDSRPSEPPQVVSNATCVPCIESVQINQDSRHSEPPRVVSNTTCVTALYNIERRDRSFDDYKQWTNETLKIPIPIVIFCKSEDAGWIREARGSRPILIIEENEIPLENLVDIVESTLPAMQRGRSNVEWVNKRYILTQFSKAIWMQRIIDRNPFDSVNFFWIDAGISRFFTGGQPDAKFPLLEASDLESDRLYIYDSGRLSDVENLSIDQSIGMQPNFVMGGVFGGHSIPVVRVCKAIIQILYLEMLAKQRIDNEQCALGLVYKANKHWFRILYQKSRGCEVVCL
jgi:hypothetical protein